jgi:hypothetical protein
LQIEPREQHLRDLLEIEGGALFGRSVCSPGVRRGLIGAGLQERGQGGQRGEYDAGHGRSLLVAYNGADVKSPS